MSFVPFIPIPESAEPILRAITLALETHLPTVLEWASPDFDLPAPKELGPVLEFRRDFPSIEIQWINSTPVNTDDDDECPPQTREHEIQIDLAIVSDKPDALIWQYLRYSKAVRAVVLNTAPNNVLLTKASGGYPAERRIGDERLLETGTLQNNKSRHLQRGTITVFARE